MPRRPGPWKGWHEEIFADACSVLLLGPAAATATTEMLRTSDASMLAEGDAYPSTFIRQQLMDELLSAGRLPRDARMPAFQPDGLDDFDLDPEHEHLRTQAKTRAGEAKRVAAKLMRLMLGDHAALPELCGWEASRYVAGTAPKGQVEYWRDGCCARTGWRLWPRPSRTPRARPWRAASPRGRRFLETTTRPGAPRRAASWPRACANCCHCAGQPGKREGLGPPRSTCEAGDALTGGVVRRGGRGRSANGGAMSAADNQKLPYQENDNPPAWWRAAIDAMQWTPTEVDGMVLWYEKKGACPRCPTTVRHPGVAGGRGMRGPGSGRGYRRVRLLPVQR